MYTGKVTCRVRDLRICIHSFCYIQTMKLYYDIIICGRQYEYLGMLTYACILIGLVIIEMNTVIVL